MKPLVAQARLHVVDPEPLARRVCEHLAEHDGVIARDGARHICDFPFGTARLTAGPDWLHLQAEASDLTSLQSLRMALASHLAEFAEEPLPDLVWTGDGSDLTVPPNFRVLRVEAVQDLTPKMRRLVFSGEDLAHFMGEEHIHARLLFPEFDDRAPEWPRLGSNGLIAWPEDNRLSSRRYTISGFDRQAGTLAIDFVRHADAGPGSAFAERALPGDRIGMIGPGGSGIPRGHEWYLLAGDETALPAVARILAALPARARGVAFIEVANPDERQDLAQSADIDVRWIYRDREPADALARSVRAQAMPRDQDVFVWAGCEFETFRALKAHFQMECGLAKDRRLVVAYWRRGTAEENPR